MTKNPRNLILAGLYLTVFIVPSATWGLTTTQNKLDGSQCDSPGECVAIPRDNNKCTDLIYTSIDQITRIGTGSEIAHYSWKNRGVAPVGYIKGMTVAYARVYCKLKAGDVAATEMAKADTGNGDKDALAWYNQQFIDAKMDNSDAGANTLRHLFVLLIGLGMRESSGRYCEGRDRSASNTSADTAEAGLFQTSYNARVASSLMPQIFTLYAKLVDTKSSDFLDIFKEGIKCKNADLENYGTGNGREFQRLSKAFPLFAVEFTAVGLRNIRKHWGPINSRTAEIRRECDKMLMQVQNAVDIIQRKMR